MLIRFEVENFRSIKECTEFSMEAYRPDRMHMDYVNEIDGKELLKVAAVYGANASGKSNLVHAFRVLNTMVIGSHFKTRGVPMEYFPFLFDEGSRQKPTRFFIDFFHQGIRYSYELMFDQHRVVSEELVHYPNKYPALVFKRYLEDGKTQYHFTTKKAKQKMISEITPDNVLYLSKAATSNLAAVQAPFEWFKDKLTVITPVGPPPLDLIREAIEKNFKECKRYINMADLGIDKFNVEEKELDQDFELELNKIFRPEARPKNNKLRSYFITSFHEIDDEYGSTTYPLDFSSESEGSQKFIALTPLWIKALKEGKVMVIDEFECQLHPHLVDALISTLKDPVLNNKNAQLIITSHDSQLMERNKFRRDQIWFAQRNPRKGATSFDSLVDFKPRNDEKIAKRYLEGRYGGIPMIRKWSLEP